MHAKNKNKWQTKIELTSAKIMLEIRTKKIRENSSISLFCCSHVIYGEISKRNEWFSIVIHLSCAQHTTIQTQKIVFRWNEEREKKEKKSTTCNPISNNSSRSFIFLGQLCSAVSLPFLSFCHYILSYLQLFNL